MVTINITILIELGLFLLFLWGTQRFVLRPVLKNMDERDDTLDRDREQTEENILKADELENQYRKEIARVRREADDQIREARRKSQQEHSDFLIEERKRADAAVREVRNEARAHVKDQRADLLKDVPALVTLIHDRLGIGPNGNGNGHGGAS